MGAAMLSAFYAAARPLNMWERSAYLCLFLFPIAGLMVRHWFSLFFVALTLVLPWRFLSRRSELEVVEKRLLMIFGLVFATSLLSAVANGAFEPFIDRLGIELRFLLFIPLYLLISRLRYGYTVFVWGLAASALVGFSQAMYAFFVHGEAVVGGVYNNQIFFTSVYAIVAVVLLDFAWEEKSSKVRRIVFYVCALLSASAVVMAGSRGGYVELLALLVLWGMVRLTRIQLTGYMGIIAITAIALYFGSDRIAQRVDDAYHDVAYYLSIEDKASHAGDLTNQGLRMEAMRTAFLIAADNPIFGVGKGSYHEAVAQYVEKGLVNPQMNHVGHPHNAYLEMFATKGVFGFTAFLLMLGYPISIFVRWITEGNDKAMPGLVLVAGYAIACLTESSPFIRGGFLAVFLISLAVFFAANRRLSPSDG